MDNSRIKYRLDLDPSDFMRRAREAQAALNALKAEASGVIYPQRRGGKEPENSPFPSVSADKANYVLPIPKHIQLPADPGFSNKLRYILTPPPRSGIVPPQFLSKWAQGGLKQLTAHAQTGAPASTDNIPAERLRKFGAEALAASRVMTALRESLYKLLVVNALEPGSIPKLITAGTIPHEPKLLGPGSIPKLYAWPPPKPKPADVFIPAGIASSVKSPGSIPKLITAGTIPHEPKLLGPGSIPKLYAWPPPKPKPADVFIPAGIASSVKSPGSIPKLITAGTIPHEPKLLGPGSIPKLYAWPPPKPKPADVFIPAGIASSVKSPGSTPKSYAWPPPKPKPAEVFNSASIRSSLKYAAGEIAGNTGWMGIGTEVRVPGQKIPFYRDRPTAMRPSTAVEFKKNYSNIYPVTALDALRGEIAPVPLSMNEAARGPRAGRPGAWDRILKPPSASVIGSTSVGGSIGSGLRSLGAGAASFMTAQRSMPNLFTLRNMIGGYAGAKLIGNISESGEKIEYLRRMYEVFYGDAKRGAKELEQTLLLARLSPFDAIEIADQRRLLRAFGIDSQRILENITNTAAATDKPLQQITISLGRLASGVYGEGFEGLRRIGISQRELFAEGLEFNPRSQQFMGTPEQAINAVMRIMERRFPNMAESMMSTWKGQKENLHDAWIQAVAPLGELMHAKLSGPMEWLSDALVDLRDGFSISAKNVQDLTGELSKLLKDQKSFIKDPVTGKDKITDLTGGDPGKSADLIRQEIDRQENGITDSGELPFWPKVGSIVSVALKNAATVAKNKFIDGDTWSEAADNAAPDLQRYWEQHYDKFSTRYLKDSVDYTNKWVGADTYEKQFELAKGYGTWGDPSKARREDNKRLFDTIRKEQIERSRRVHFIAMNEVLKDREVFSNRSKPVLEELDERDAAARAAEIRDSNAKKNASRNTLLKIDTINFERLSNEIASRQENLNQNTGYIDFNNISEADSKRFYAEQRAIERLEEIRRRVAERIHNPSVADRYIASVEERQAKVNIERANRDSAKYDNQNGVNVRTSQTNNTYIYGQPGGTLTGAAGAYGGAR